MVALVGIGNRTKKSCLWRGCVTLKTNLRGFASLGSGTAKTCAAFGNKDEPLGHAFALNA
jgi:hypothetical protein